MGPALLPGMTTIKTALKLGARYSPPEAFALQRVALDTSPAWRAAPLGAKLEEVAAAVLLEGGEATAAVRELVGLLELIEGVELRRVLRRCQRSPRLRLAYRLAVELEAMGRREQRQACEAAMRGDAVPDCHAPLEAVLDGDPAAARLAALALRGFFPVLSARFVAVLDEAAAAQ